MTLEDMIYELWELLGRPVKEDLDPTDGLGAGVVAGGVGTRRLGKVLDWAQTQVAAWKDPRLTGRPMWWTGSYRSFTIEVSPFDLGIGQNVGTNLNQVLGANPPASGQAGGVVRVAADPLVVGGLAEECEIVVETGGTLIAYPALNTVSTGRQAWVCPRWVDLTRSWRARNVHQVKLLGTGGGEPVTLKMSPRGDQLNGGVEVGEPSLWTLKGGRVWLDKAVGETRYFRLECEVAPATLVVDDPGNPGALLLTTESELPEQFHGLIVLYAAAYGQGLLQDLEQQTLRRGQFRDDMMMTVDQADTRMDLDQGLSLKLEVK